MSRFALYQKINKHLYQKLALSNYDNASLTNLNFID